MSSYPPGPSGPDVQPGPGTPGRRHWFELVMSAVVVVAAIVLIVWYVAGQLGGDSEPTATPTSTSSSDPTIPSSTTPSTTTGPGTTSTTDPTETTETNATTGGATTTDQPGPGSSPPHAKDSGVRAVGLGWPASADTYHFTNEGIPAFDGPSDWGCLTMGKGDLGYFHVNCVNDGGTFPTHPNGSGGAIVIYPCEAGCNVAEATSVVDAVSEFTDPVAAGDDLVTASETDPEGDKPGMVTLVMATPWQAGPGNKIVLARISAVPSDAPGVQHMLRSIYDSAHGRT